MTESVADEIAAYMDRADRSSRLPDNKGARHLSASQLPRNLRT